MVNEGVSIDQQFFSEINTRLRDIEEKQRLLKDRIILIGQSFVDGKEKIFKDHLEMKKEVIKLKDENLRMKEFIQRISERLDDLARKEELMILQRQFDLFRKP